MAESHVISALVSKRSELAGQLDQLNKQISQMKTDISTVDAAIKLFDPSYKIQSIRPKKQYKLNPYFDRGELHRMILEIVRDSAPTSTPDLTARIIDSKGLTVDDDALAKIQQLISATLSRQKHKGLVRSVKIEGLSVWEVA